MRQQMLWRNYFLLLASLFLLSSCASMSDSTEQPSDDNASNLPLYHGQAPYSSSFNEQKYINSLPQKYNTGNRKMVLVDPKVHAWGAYDANGELVRGGIATAGGDFCKDINRSCRTTTGTFRMYSLGDDSCVSRKFPLGKGGALMPYCMFFNNGESLHGTPDQMMSEENISHGCIHMRIPDAEWLRYNFASIGTKVVILPY